MKHQSHITIVVMWIVASLSFVTGQTLPYSTFNRDAIVNANKFVNTYNLERKRVNNIVKVVYFHAADQEPLNNWNERLTITLSDVSQYYREEFEKYGIESEGIPFEKDHAGKFVFHVIQGASPSKEYNKDSGQKIENEIYNASNHTIDFRKDYVLIINGLCDKLGDGSYSFHSPYYGKGSLQSGVCHVADCEWLDSRLLTDTTQTMIFSEMFVNNKKCHVAEFNSWYIGGIAHELGHVFGLPHDYGNPEEFDSATISLMGQYGSRHYRDYLWNGEKSAAFSAASILQLLSHPVFTRTTKYRIDMPEFALTHYRFNQNNSNVVVQLNYKSKIDPYGVVALVRPITTNEYFNRSYSAFTAGKNELNIEIGDTFSPDTPQVLLLAFLFPEGSSYWRRLFFTTDDKGNVHEILLGNVPVNMSSFYEELSKEEKTTLVKEKLKILQEALNPVEPIDPITYPQSKLYLSDAKWEVANVGWGKIARNYYSTENKATFFLENKGELYSKGIYAHSPSLFSFNLGGKWKKFSAIVGIRDRAHIQGSARFTVIGDGKVLYESSPLRVNQQSVIDINIENIKILELKAEGTEGHNHNSWAVWLNPLIEK